MASPSSKIFCKASSRQRSGQIIVKGNSNFNGLSMTVLRIPMAGIAAIRRSLLSRINVDRETRQRSLANLEHREGGHDHKRRKSQQRRATLDQAIGQKPQNWRR